MALWWVFTTTTTVGYGDMAPTSAPGKMLGVLTFYVGIIFLALPIGVLSSNFEIAYDKQQGRVRHHGMRHGDPYRWQAGTYGRASLFSQEEDPVGPSPWLPQDESIRTRIFNALNNPGCSVLARLLSYFSMLLIVATTTTLILAVCVFYIGIVLVAIKLTIVGGAFRRHYPKWHARV
eukprot:gb/GFBE01047721.1/.p1 GENE.gb/GFBE01047721.1/~~gb/GFBE01047721.1/.p1  ORF type:complete len:177 (+),score=25.48 gb/GFBE01047721.1/:1-531(+)